jgi:hypothetical protein
MPTINVYYNDNDISPKLDDLSEELKDFAATQLTCSDIRLTPDEISVRLIKNRGNGMLAPVELEIKAAAFKERVQKQDEICLSVQKLIKFELQIDSKVWLVLSELGHSWQDT